MESGLKPPERLNVTSPNLSQAWKHWKEEFGLFVELTVAPRDENRKIKLFHYLIGEKGREISQTLSITSGRDDNPTLRDIIQAFDKYCDPKKNETVERYTFFSRNQEPGENIDTYVTELKILASTCEFGDIRDSLIRDRIVCGIRDTHLRERLLREENLALEKCLQICRASELTKDSLKMIEGPSESMVHAVTGKGKIRYKIQGVSILCKYCGKRHERDKEKCPAYGQTCRLCGKRNHFSAQCRQSSKSQHRAVNTVTQDTDSDSTEDIMWLQLQSAAESVNVVKPPMVNDSNQLFATFLLDKKPNKFQLDCGASCNVIPCHMFKKEVKLEHTDQVLMMYNKSMLKTYGLKLHNPCNKKSYRLEFTVVKNRDHMPLLGVKAVQAMDLIKVQFHNIMALQGSASLQSSPEKLDYDLDLQIIQANYADLFKGDGCLEGKYKLEVNTAIEPPRLPTRRVPVALMQPLKEELQDLHSRHIIEPVQKSTDWISSLVIVKKPSGKLRICIDPKPLNKTLKRNHYPMPTIEDILPDLSEARIFSVCDVKNRFWHVELDEKSKVFQQRLNQALEGLAGVKTIADDILIVGEGDSLESATRDHDLKMIKLLERCRQKGIKLNLEKCKLKMTDVPYIGHLLTSSGLKVDPEKVRAIQEMPAPTDVRGVQHFLGMVNYLSKFCGHLSDMCEPLRQLTHKDSLWEWTEIQQTAFDSVKQGIADAATLKYYNPLQAVVIQCDASENGLGATLMQEQEPEAFASRALTTTERGYSQIEKELLAVVFGMEKFHQYTYGRHVTVHSDHKPLETITKKPLINAPKRLQLMLLRLQKYDCDISYCPGKDLLIADALSRAYLPNSHGGDKDIETINMCEYLPMSKDSLKEIQTCTEHDSTMQILKTTILQGWPKYKQYTPLEISLFDKLSIHQGIIFKGERVVIPGSLRRDIMERLHSSHIGIEGCLCRAQECVHWPGMNDQIKKFITQCEICASCGDKQPKETLQPHEIPDRPWSKVGTDLLTWNEKDFLITVDYYSNFWEVDYLQDTRSKTVIKKLKAHFSRHGIPDILFSDNAAQFTSEEFKQFSKKWEFEHNTSSPGYPQSNSKAESAVKMAKKLMRKAKQAGTDIYLMLLELRNIPTQGLGSSPVQRLMCRRTKTLFPITKQLLNPELAVNIKSKLKLTQNRQAQYYNKSARDLPTLQINDNVWVQPLDKYSKHWQKAKVIKTLGHRSYLVRTEEGKVLRRNRRHLKKTGEPDDWKPHRPFDDQNWPSSKTPTADLQGQPRQEATEICGEQENGQPTTNNDLHVSEVPHSSKEIPYVSRAGRMCRKPAHLKDYI
uniref:Gypsy retrotransposon integrase-like protein 1 n=1 Tax=Xenopus tropicalis TaxID=8364 RepID=A0A1B8Y8I2_XENTR